MSWFVTSHARVSKPLAEDKNIDARVNRHFSLLFEETRYEERRGRKVHVPALFSAFSWLLKPVAVTVRIIVLSPCLDLESRRTPRRITKLHNPRPKPSVLVSHLPTRTLPSSAHVSCNAYSAIPCVGVDEGVDVGVDEDVGVGV